MKENNIEDRINKAYCFLNSMYSDFRTGLYYKEDLENLEHLLSDYKKLQEEFKQVDHECERLEEKEVRLLKENEKLKNKIMEKELEIIGKEEYTKASMGEIIEQYYTANEECVSIQKIKDKIKDLNRKIDESIDNSKGGLDEEFIEKSGELLAQKRILQELLGGKQ